MAARIPLKKVKFEVFTDSPPLGSATVVSKVPLGTIVLEEGGHLALGRGSGGTRFFSVGLADHRTGLIKKAKIPTIFIDHPAYSKTALLLQLKKGVLEVKRMNSPIAVFPEKNGLIRLGVGTNSVFLKRAV